MRKDNFRDFIRPQFYLRQNTRIDDESGIIGDYRSHYRQWENSISMLWQTVSSSWGHCTAITRDGWRWIVDAHREGRRYIVHSDELLSAFLELEQTLLWSGALLRNNRTKIIPRSAK